jgi:hypothetical protein
MIELSPEELSFWNITPCSPLKVKVEEHVSIFKVEEKEKHETSMKQVQAELRNVD